MTDRKAKTIATATVLGLGALGGVALGSNPGAPSPTLQAASEAGASIVTSASGSGVLPANQTVALQSEPSRQRAPIVTRASGGGAQPAVLDD